MNNKKVHFRFMGYKIVKSSIILPESTPINNKLQVSLKQVNGTFAENREYRHEMTINVSNEDKSIQIEVKSIGYFEFDTVIEDKEQLFVKQNAPAILFPYIRAHISALTGLSGISPIILPTINTSIK